MQKKTQKTTIRFDLEVYRALKIKAAETSRSMSDLVSDAVATACVEDAFDLETFEKRKNEPAISFRELRRRLSRHARRGA